MAAPTRVSYAPTSTPFASTAASRQITDVTFAVGDQLEVKASAANHGTSANVTPVLSAGAVIWTKYADQGTGTTTSGAWSWVGVVTTGASNATVTLARPTTGAFPWDFTVGVVSGSSGVGQRFEGGNATGSGAPSVVRACAANSLLTCQINDWNAVSGASRVWRAGITGTLYQQVTNEHTVYGGVVPDSGAAQSWNLGLTAPSNQRWVMSGFEFLGTSGSAFSAAVGLTGSGTLTFGARPGFAGTANLTGSGTLGFGTSLSTAAVLALSGSGQLTMSGQLVVVGAVALSGSGTLSLTSTPRQAASLGLTGSGALTFAGAPGTATGVALSGSGTLSMVAAPSQAAAVSLTGSGSLSFVSTPRQAASVELSGSGQLSTTATPASGGAVALGGSGTLSLSTGSSGSSSVSLTGSGQLTAGGKPALARTLNLTGSGSLVTTGGSPGARGSVALTGAGTLSFAAAAAARATVELTGSGALGLAVPTSATGAVTLSGKGQLTVIGQIPGQVSLGLSVSGVKPSITVLPAHTGSAGAVQRAPSVTLGPALSPSYTTGRYP